MNNSMSINRLTEFTYFRGRVALYAILKALGLKKGDNVVTQAFTCIAVPEAIIASGAYPIYADLNDNSFNMDADDLKHKITTKTRAIIVQHTFGIPSNMDSVIQIADEMGIPIIEDNCHTLISKYKGKIVGNFGVASFYSYEWGKPIVVGIGGSAVVNDKSLLKKVEHQYSDYHSPETTNQFRLQLQYLAHRILYRPSLFWRIRSLYHFLGSFGAAESNYNPIQGDRVAIDFSLKMSEILKNRLSKKLLKLEAVAQHSKNVVAEYSSRINSPTISKPELPLDCDPVFARYPLISRDKPTLLAKARKANVELADWYSSPVHPLEQDDWGKVYYKSGSCPNAEKRCKRVVTLPTHQAVGPRDVDRSIKFLNHGHF